MKEWMSLAKNLSGNKAQALVELAVFGSIILLVLGFLVERGLQYNKDLNLKMQTFRQALSSAYGKGQDEDASINLVVLKDKTSPSTQDAFGFTPHYPFPAGAGAVWSNYLQIGYDNSDFGKPEFLPKITLIVNDESRPYTLTTAGYKEVECTDTTKIKKKTEDYKDEYLIDGSGGQDGIYWYWKKGNCDDVKEQEYADVDGDDKEELVLEKARINCHSEYDWESGTEEEVCDTGLRVIDSQEGELDLTSDITREALRKEIPQGSASAQFTSQNTRLSLSLQKKENQTKITNITRINAEEKFYRFILLKKITAYPGYDYENIQQQIDKDNRQKGYDCAGKDKDKCDKIYEGDKYGDDKGEDKSYTWLAITTVHKKDAGSVSWETSH